MARSQNRMLRASRSIPVGIALGAAALWVAACSSKKDLPPAAGLPATMTAPADPGSCSIDAFRMCDATGGDHSSSSPQPASSNMPPSYYAPPSSPDTVEFQIPAGQAIKLMCYYDPQHKSVIRADATPETTLTAHSVEYLKSQKFCK